MITREDEDLLLIDLSGRLKYGVKVCIKLPNHQEKVFEDHVGELLEITKSGGYLVNVKGIDYRSLSLDIKPYLRPLSSMTEEEREYIEDKCAFTTIGPIGGKFCLAMPVVAAEWLIDFYNSNHLDYRGLIEKGLALEAPEDMYN